MNAYKSPSPKRALLPSSTPAVNRLKNLISPQLDHSNRENQSDDKCSTRLHEFSPIFGTFLSPSSTIHRSKGPNSSIASSFANSLDHKDLSNSELLDRLSRDPSAFAAHLRDSLVYSEQLRPSIFQSSYQSSSSLQASSADPVPSHSTLLERICGSLAQSIRSDVSMLLEYKEQYPEVLEIQAKNVFIEEVDEDYEVDTKLLLHPILNSDRQISDALNYLHTNFYLVHGDIKPSNILIQLPDDEAHKAYFSDEMAAAASTQCIDILQSDAPSGIVFKLSDFGRSSLASNTREREGLGDGRYLPSLEDPSDRVRVAFGRDIYALGVTLYHAAGGDMGFSSLERFRDGEFSYDDALVLPPTLRPIVTSMLKRYAADRPTPSDLLANLPFIGSN
ncbi:unnamed protein product [Taenia asiatica]|uniref:Protein kinase domain-containing protein n=1 Tax=Taenia asiatica TaxID=60517 RepID=A0A0R3W730_TAEAS|nr:unnamed protein product [Taenia asiatica]